MDKDLETLEHVELGNAKQLTKGPFASGPKEDNPDFVHGEFT